MGKILNIRVMAQTYNEDEVARAWPRLCSIVWPKWFARLGFEGLDKKVPGLALGETPVEKALGAKTHGVVELASALPDLVKLGDLPKNVAAVLEEPAADVERAAAALAAALGNWDVKKATPLTFELEDALGKAEESLKKM